MLNTFQTVIFKQVVPSVNVFQLALYKKFCNGIQTMWISMSPTEPENTEFSLLLLYSP